MECAVCKKKADYKCGSCNKTHYCSVDHQKKDWRIHKESCAAFQIVETSAGSKQWICTRSLKAGTVLLEEEPILYFPDYSKAVIQELCITCGERMESPGARLCRDCNWPVCSDECEKNVVHREGECNKFRKDKVLPRSTGNLDRMSSVIAGVRGAGLRSRDKEAYKQLLGLPVAGLRGNPGVERACNEGLDLMQVALPSFDIAGLDVRKILQVVDFNMLTWEGNGAEIYSDRLIEVSRLSRSSIYPSVSNFTHSCAPNCSWSIGPAPEMKIRIRTAVPLKKGEVLTLTKGYDLRHHGMGTYQRQVDHLIPRGIHCKCPRCIDPTELESFISAKVCSSCFNSDKTGYFLPEYPLDFSPESKYKCSSCGARMPRSEVIKEERQAWNLILQLLLFQLVGRYAHEDSDDTVVTEARKAMEGFHSNHWAYIDFMKKRLLGNPASRSHLMDSTFKYEVLEKQIAYLTQCLLVEDKISPGINSSKAKIVAALACKLKVQIFCHLDEMTQTQFRTKKRLHDEFAREALKYYDGDFEDVRGNPAGQLRMNVMLTDACVGASTRFCRHSVPDLFDLVEGLFI